MDFVVLGEVEARVDGRTLRLGGPKQLAMLAMLLLAANRPVSRDRLIEGLWGEAPPRSAVQTLDDYVSKLRRLLGDRARLDRKLVDRAVWIPLVSQRIIDVVSMRLRNYEFSPVYHFLPAQATLR